MKRSIVKLCLIIVLIIPISVFANDYVKEYVNDNDVHIPYETYLKMKNIYTDLYLSVLTQDEYDYIDSLNLDYDNAHPVTQYVKTIYNTITGQATNYIISEEEYNVGGYEPAPKTIFYETGYKRIDLLLEKLFDDYAYASFTATWKKMPALRSFDVIAMRTVNLSKVNGTQSGKQLYTTTAGQNLYVDYPFNGTNINNFSNGFGISMNLVDNSITALQCYIHGTFVIDDYAAVVYASYQHATSNVSLATSKSYYLTNGGLGNAIMFDPTSIAGNYDGMSGVMDYISS